MRSSNASAVASSARARSLALAHGACYAPPASTANARPRRRRSRTRSRAHFAIGAALNERSVHGTRRRAARRSSKAQFNTITPENVLKWEIVHPRPGRVRLRAGRSRTSRSVSATACSSSGTRSCGTARCRAGSSRTPTGKPLDARRAARAHARPHHDRRRPLQGTHQGLGRRQRSAERRRHAAPVAVVSTIIGDDYLVKAFQFAHEADPAAELYYNDYSLENAPKRNGAVALVETLQAAGVHGRRRSARRATTRWTGRRAAQYDSTITAFARARREGQHHGARRRRACRRRRRIRRADVGARARQASREPLNPYAPACPTRCSSALATRYADLFARFRQAPGRHRSRYVLGSRRRRFVAQQLARARTDELSAAVRPAAISRSRRSTP